MKTRWELKTAAKRQLRGQWGMASFFVFVYFVITAIMSVLAGDGSRLENLSAFNWIFAVLNVFVSAAMTYALTHYALQIAKGKRADFSSLSAGFANLARAWWVQLIVSIFVTVINFVLTFIFDLSAAIGAGVGSVMSLAGSVTALQTANFGILQAVGTVIIFVINFVIGLLLSQVWFVIVDNPRVGAIGAIKASWRMMRGHLGSYLMLSLSFIGWLFLAALTCGVALFWIIPYMEVTFANFYEAVKPRGARRA